MERRTGRECSSQRVDRFTLYASQKMKTPVLLFFLLPLLIYAQSSDQEVFHVRYNVTPLSRNTETDALHAFDMNIKFPLMVRDKTILAGGLGYESLWTNEFPLFGGNNVHGISTQWMFNHSYGTNRALLIVGSAGIYSDLKDLSVEDIRYAFGVRYKTKLHEKFTMSYGLGISKQFFGVMVAPFIDFEWHITSQLRLSGPLPLNTRIRYVLSTRAELTLFLKPENATYRLSEDNSSKYLQKKQWNTGLGFDYLLARHWLLSVKGGYSLRRSFEIYEASQTGVLSILTIDLAGGKRTPSYEYEEKALFTELTLAWIIAKD